jgi:molybdopterin converting factor small subunit
VYPKWFIYQQQKILNEKLSELYTNTYSKTPDARNSQYMKGIAEFNETFDELFADLPQTQYRNMANDVYTGFYEEFETELDKARTDGKNINTFIKTFIYDRLKSALEFQMIEDQRKAILGDELRRQLDLDDQAISDAQKEQAGDNVFTGGTPIENENKDVDTSVETGVDNYIKEIDKAGGDFEKSLLGRKITVGEYNQVSFNGEKTKIQKGDYFVGDDGYTYSALVDGARPNAFVRVKDGKPIMYKGKPISYRK